MKKRLLVMTFLCTFFALLTFTTGCNVDSDSTTYYTVSFDSNGGTPVASQSVESGKKAVEPKSPTRTDYTFVAWNKGGSAFDFATPITADTTLTAQWKSASENDDNDSNTEGKDDDSGNNGGNGGAGQVITVTAESLASLSLTDSSYGDTYTLKLTGEWTNDDILTLGSKVRAISGKNISVDMTQTTGITEIKLYSFQYASSLASVSFPDSLVTISSNAFYRCTALTSIEIPEGVTSIGNYAFSGCTSLTSIEIPESVTSIGGSVFSGCTSLTSIEISEGVTRIARSAFSGCTSLTSIEIPESVTSIGGSAFSGCTSLTSIEIPESVTSVGVKAFSDCTSLTTAQFDSSQITDTDKVFPGCAALTNIIVISTYKVCFDSNGGNGSMKTQSFRVDVEKALSPNAFTSSNENYVFAGWNTESDGSGTFYADGAVVKNLSTEDKATVNLYAQWVLNVGTYTVVFDANGGEGTMDSLAINATIYKELPANAFTRKNYKFKDWNTAADGTGFSYSDGNSIYKDKEAVGTTITLYAQWKLTTYYITFDGNGGEGSMEVQTCSTGNSVTLSENAFTRAGYKFESWNTAADGSGETVYSKFHNYMVSGEYITLYAQWTANTYYIDFDRNGGSGSYMSYLKCTVGTPVTLTENTFTRKSYAFTGWNTAADGSGTSYADGETVLNLTLEKSGTVTLYAQWKATTYFVKFDKNNSYASGTMSTLTCTIGTPITLTVNAFTRTNYTFTGWNTAQDGSGTSYADGETVQDLTLEAGKTITLYAQWGYTITFDANGGTGSMEKQIFALNTTQTLPANAFTRDGYIFAGWNTKANGNGTSYSDEASVTNLTSLTLYAQWNQECIVYASEVSSIDFSNASYGNPYTIYLRGTWTSENLKTLGTTLKTVSDKNITLDMTQATGITDLAESTFADCTSLVSVLLPNTLKNIGSGAFERSGLASIEIPDSVESIGISAFMNTSLTSVEIPVSVTSIGEYAFAVDTLKTVRYNGNIESYLNISVDRDGGISSLWSECEALYLGEELVTNLIIPASITNIRDGAFAGCLSIKSIVISSGVTSIGNYAFSGCESLESIVIPSSVTTIGKSAFSWCLSLTSVDIPSGVKTIGDGAFNTCTALKSVTISSSVKTIGVAAFAHDTALSSITFTGTTSQWGSISKPCPSGYLPWNYEAPAKSVICSNGSISL